MKKYKLIKEYPGSPKLGREVTSRLISPTIPLFHIKKEFVLNHPEFWQEVIEKDYEVMEFLDGTKYFIKENERDYYNQNGNSRYQSIPAHEIPFEEMKITKVKRLSDGEVFEVGENIKNSSSSDRIYVINRFIDEDYFIRVEGKYKDINDGGWSFPLCSLEKIKTPDPEISEYVKLHLRLLKEHLSDKTWTDEDMIEFGIFLNNSRIARIKTLFIEFKNEIHREKK